jgi:hypothetical protein
VSFAAAAAARSRRYHALALAVFVIPRMRQMKTGLHLILRAAGQRAESVRSDLPGAAARFEDVVGYVSLTTNIVKVSMDICASITGVAKGVTFFATAALRLSLFGDAASL